uniref:Lipase n=1 Tax=Panagrolaimus davidi TaxID=227884 RepID=A0A914QDE2_9BILA
MKHLQSFLISFTVFLSLSVQIFADFSLNFKNFIQRTYGAQVLQQLERPDMGLGLSGSFGGRTFDTDFIRRDPIIFVHGAGQRAGNFIGSYFYFLGKGYTAAELYSTTYGDGGITPQRYKTLACDDVKQIRGLLQTVAAYTNRTVNIIAFGEGTPIARKAILGGSCVDTRDSLGAALTTLVNTFISVAGVGYGKQFCNPQEGGCNLNNGMYCNSAFLTELNTPATRFEGRFSYYIYSDNDQVIEQNCCNTTVTLCSQLKNCNSYSRQPNMLHDSILSMTQDIQLAMLSSGGTYNGTLYQYGYGNNLYGINDPLYNLNGLFGYNGLVNNGINTGINALNGLNGFLG